MRTTKEITLALFDADGSARDITFTHVEPQRLGHLFDEIEEHFVVYSATDHDGRDVRNLLCSDSISDLWKSPSGNVCSYWHSDTQVISELQVFFLWPATDGTAFVELTFFPEDLVRERFHLEQFMWTVERWREALKAEDYFVRYENVGKKEFDGSDPDVIFTRHTRPKKDLDAVPDAPDQPQDSN